MNRKHLVRLTASGDFRDRRETGEAKGPDGTKNQPPQGGPTRRLHTPPQPLGRSRPLYNVWPAACH
jgi:hypothetical protein